MPRNTLPELSQGLGCVGLEEAWHPPLVGTSTKPASHWSDCVIPVLWLAESVPGATEAHAANVPRPSSYLIECPPCVSTLGPQNSTMGPPPPLLPCFTMHCNAARKCNAAVIKCNTSFKQNLRRILYLLSSHHRACPRIYWVSIC